MKVLYLGFLAVYLNAADPNAILKSQLMVRTAQVAAKDALIHLQQVQADPVYRKALAAAETAEAATKVAIIELSKQLNCEIDPVTVECKLPLEVSK